MSRVSGMLVALLVATASTAAAQGGGRGMALPDHWLSADSLSKAVGGDAALAAKVAPHLAEVDKVLKAAADERGKMMAGGGRPDQATMEAMRTKAAEWQKAIDTHLGVIRSGLDAKQQAAFDALQKPQVMGGGRRGGGGGGPPN